MSKIKMLSDTLSQSLAPDKWEFLYNYARKCLDEDLNRFQLIDAKAGKFLTLVSVVFGVFSAITSWLIEKHLPPTGCFSWLVIITIIITFVALILSWSFLFRAIKLAKAPRMPLTDSVEKLIREKEFPNIYYALTKTCRTALEENRLIIDLKGNLIKKAYTGITFSAWLIVINTLFIIILELT